MMHVLYILFLSILSLFFRLACLGNSKSLSLDFPREFISHYDLTKRDTHEYNAYTLAKTRKSFLELEQAIKQAGMVVEGRLGILGYQEEAVRPYTTDWERIALEDEAIVKTHAGIAQPTRNIFGFMTGFLLKDVQTMQAEWFKNQEPNIIHSLGRNIELFNDSAVIFQKHSFGKDYDMLISTRDAVERAAYSKNLKHVLERLVSFWNTMEERATKTTSQETVATQDMLFSIAYAQALLEGKAPIKKLFVGPDITYPIEVLSCQKAQATINAQKFVQKFQEYLTPIDDKSTAYIFCSFVDGVGKSTMLNNIQNWGIHGNNFEAYQRCDNSSSQEATLFTLRDNVSIVDLPAQLSHFVIKPDGNVFVDVHTVKDLTIEHVKEVQKYSRKHALMHTLSFHKRVEELSQQQPALYSLDNPVDQYAHNCAIMQLKDIAWIPFEYNGRCFLYNVDDPHQLRVLVPLAGAHSTGLKALDTEQMLFSKGLSLPMRYSCFIDGLLQKLKNAGVEKVVFVDFLSMYPRSSRETIRLNFVLQYIKKIFGPRFDFEHSFYQHWVHKAQQLCYMLYKNLDACTQSLVFETALRWALDILLDEAPLDTVSTLSGIELEQRLSTLVTDILTHKSVELYKIAYARLEPEQQEYYNTYQFDRIYQTLVRFSFKPVYAFSNLLQELFTTIQDDYTQELWSGLDGSILPGLETTTKFLPAQLPTQTILTNNTLVEITSSIHQACREERTIKEFVRSLRAQWYSQLSNLLNSTVEEDKFSFNKIDYPTPALVVKLGLDDQVNAIQKNLPLIDTRKTPLKSPSLFNLFDQTVKRRWGLFDNMPHCLDWSNQGTYTGLYAYSYDDKASGKNNVTRIVDRYRQIAALAGISGVCLTTSKIHEQLSNPQIRETLKAEIAAKKPQILDISDPRIPGIRLWVRAIATLDMILKDVDSRIIIRKDNNQDFLCAVQLLEYVTLPLYFGIQCKQPLFSDYTSVEPLISWELINT